MSAAAEAREPLADEPRLRSRGHWQQALRRLSRQPGTIVAFILLVGLFVIGALAPQIAPQGWNAIDLSSRWANHAPTLSGWHLLGTDNIGRDVLVRTLYGLHDTEAAALAGALLASILGVTVGVLAGYYGGWLDLTLMRVTDLVTAFPAIVLMLAAFVFLAPMTTTRMTLVFALYMWTFVARAVRARIAPLATEEFVDAARALGATDGRIIWFTVDARTGQVIGGMPYGPPAQQQGGWQGQRNNWQGGNGWNGSGGNGNGGGWNGGGNPQGGASGGGWERGSGGNDRGNDRGGSWNGSGNGNNNGDRGGRSGNRRHGG